MLRSLLPQGLIDISEACGALAHDVLLDKETVLDFVQIAAQSDEEDAHAVAKKLLGYCAA